jgi:ABC-2 type transport system permease protein
MSSFALLGRQIGFEQRSFWRNPQTAFFTAAMPLGLLVTLGFLNAHERVPGRDNLRTITFIVPGVIAFAILSANYANLAATIVILRDEGVLKRLRATPIPRWIFLGGHLGSSLVTTSLVAMATVAGGELLFGVAVTPAAIPSLLVSVCVGSACFCALGLAVTSAIPTADAASAVVNATYLPLALASGIFLPGLVTPRWLSLLTSLFPVKPLFVAIRRSFDPATTGTGFSLANLSVLGAWTVVGVVVALRFFRWSRDER